MARLFHSESTSERKRSTSSTYRRIDEPERGELVWNTGLFYDRENSLLASLFISGLTDDVINLSLYPGVIGSGSFSPGAWLIVNRKGGVQVGVPAVWFPGLALGKH